MAVEPSVEDLFVSFVDEECKGGVREQLLALADAVPALDDARRRT